MNFANPFTAPFTRLIIYYFCSISFVSRLFCFGRGVIPLRFFGGNPHLNSITSAVTPIMQLLLTPVARLGLSAIILMLRCKLFLFYPLFLLFLLLLFSFIFYRYSSLFLSRGLRRGRWSQQWIATGRPIRTQSQ